MKTLSSSSRFFQFLPALLAACFFFIFLGFAQAQNDSNREKNRQLYESTTLQQYENLPFSDVPWRVIFNDGLLSFQAVSNLFLAKLKAENIDLPATDRKLYKRWLMYNTIMKPKQRADGKFIFDDEAMAENANFKNGQSQAENMVANFQFISQANSTFYTNNGRIERVNFHPTNTNIIWASAPEGGLWKSTDAGLNWTIVSDFWDHLSVGDLVFDPTNSNIIYAATDDHDSWFNNNRGVLKSTDGGTTWSIVGLPYSQANNVFKLLIHPSGSPLYACTSQGLFQSTNGGVTWTLNAALPANVNDLEFHPTNNMVMYATTRGGASPNFGYFYVSTNGGTTFTQKTATLDSKGRTTQVCVSPNNPDIAYIGVYPEPPHYTTTGGMLMRYVHSTGVITTRTAPSYVFPNIWVGGAWDFRVEVDPADANHVIYGCVFNYESFNGGTTYSNVNSPHADVHDIKWQAGTNRLWIADDGGLGYSTDAGATWTTVRKLPVMQFYSVVSNDDGTVKTMGAQDAGVHVDQNGFWFVPTGGDGLEVKIDPVNDKITYGSIQNGLTIDRVIYSPATQTYSVSQIMNQTIAGGFDATWRQKIIIDPEDRSVLYTNYRDVFKTTNNGTSWTNVSGGTIGNGTTPLEHLYQSKSHPNIFITGWGNQMRKSTNGGVTWSSITHPGIGIYYQSQLVIHPTNPDIMWAAAWGNVRKTINGGTTWTDISGTLPGSAGLNGIAYQEGTADGLYVVGLLGKVYYKDNTLGDWILYNTNLPNVRLMEVEALPHINKVRVATWGRGVWESATYANSTNLCVEPAPPAITTNMCGNTATITISQSTPSGYNIKWFKDGVEIAGQTGTSLTVTVNGVYRARYLANTGTCHSYYGDVVNIVFKPAVVVNGGEGLNFDGNNDHVVVPANVVDVAAKPFTVEFWAKRNIAEAWDFILNQGYGQANKTLIIGYNGSNQMMFSFSWEFFSPVALTASASVSSDTDWHHWAFVYNPAIASPGHNRFIYRDGIVVASDRNEAGLSSSGIATIGKLTPTDHLHGILDEIRVWGVARTQAQIQELMFCPLPCINNDVQLYLPLEDGIPNGTNTGLTTVTDYSFNNAMPTLNNFQLTGSTSNFTHSFNKTLYADADGDGFGSQSVWTCGSTANISDYNIDGNDSNASIHPNVEEVCGNSVDENGNGIADENTLALSFDGTNDEVNLGNQLGNFGAGDFTVEAKIKTSATNDYLLSKRGICGLDNFWNISINATGRLQIEICETTGGANYGLLTGTTNITNNAWHHIAVTRTGGTVRLYVNGIQEASGSMVANINNTTNLKIGTNICGNAYGGQIDELRFWNTARPAVQIADLMDAFLPASMPGMIAYYDFNNAAAVGGGNNAGQTTLEDRTGTYNGTLANFALTGSTSNWIGNPLQSNCTSVSIPTISISGSPSMDEGNAGNTAFIFTATRTGNTANASSASWEVTGFGSNPANAADFGGTLPSGTVSFPAGSSVTQPITVNVSGDNDLEPNEGFTVTLSNPTNANLGTTTAGGTIVNDDTGATYCAAGATSTNASYEKISNVQFNTINNASTSSEGYENFTAVSTTVEQGSTHTFTGTISNPYPSDEIIVWIDFNQDMDFSDPGEEVFNSPAGGGPHSGSITISPTAITGNTRMRVRLHDTGAGPNTTPCGNSTYGQVEDYTINITASGTAGASLDFDGTNDYISLPANLTASLNNFTLETWVFWDGSSEWQRIFDFGNNTSTYMFLTPNAASTNKPRFAITNGSGELQINSSVAATTGQWQHYTIVLDDNANTGILYIDGVQAGSNTNMTPTPASLGNLTNNWLGRSQWASDPYFNGKIGEIRIWNFPRTSQQIQCEMDEALVGNEAGLVAYYNFNQGAGGGSNAGVTTLNDLTANNNDGTLVNFALSGASSNWVAPTFSGKTLDFATDDYVTGTNASLPVGNTARTIECWMKSAPASAAHEVFFNYGTATASQRASLGVSPGGKVFYSGENNDLEGTINIRDGIWHHCAATFDGTTLRLYVDGVPDGSQAKTFNTVGATFNIGRKLDNTEYFDGQLDELRVWDYARTQEQIITRKNVELLGTETGLVAYFKFNQGVAGANNAGLTTLRDWSPTNANGTLNGFALNGNTSNWAGPGALTEAPGTGCCPTILAVTGVITSGTYNAMTEIYSDGVIPAGSNVTFKGTGVTLQKEFQVLDGGLFSMMMQACTP